MTIEGNRSVVDSRYFLKELKRQVGSSKVKQVVLCVTSYFSDNQQI